jgi:DNA modification methylase
MPPLPRLRDDPFYETPQGAAYLGDSRELLAELPNACVQAIITSPPYALRTKKKYGNASQDEYVEWFLGFVDDFVRVLTPDGSLVIEIGGAWNRGSPTRSIYLFELLVELVRKKNLHLCQDFYWLNKARMPSPAEWVTVQRIRVKDAVTPIWWLSPSPKPKASNRNVLKPYSAAQLRLFERGYNGGKRPSGHVARKFENNNGGAIPPNVVDTRDEKKRLPENLMELSHTAATNGYQRYCRENGLDAHPARFPSDVPEFFVKFLTSPGDLVLDPFAGSNTTGAVAEAEGRRWLAFEKNKNYLKGSRGRFVKFRDDLLPSKRKQ